MVLSDKFAAKPRAGLLKRTLLYVLGFGLGSLAIASVLSFTLMSIAGSVIPSKDAVPADSGAPGTAPKIIGSPEEGVEKSKTKLAPRPASKARRPRANEASGAATKSSDQPL